MATDKALNIRQIKATEAIAEALGELRQGLAEVKGALSEVRAELAALAEIKGALSEVRAELAALAEIKADLDVVKKGLDMIDFKAELAQIGATLTTMEAAPEQPKAAKPAKK